MLITTNHSAAKIGIEERTEIIPVGTRNINVDEPLVDELDEID